MLQILPILLISSLPPITIKPFVYQLKLEGDNHYVGITYNLNLRYAQHLSGNGAKWTKLHKPMSIQSVWTDGNVELENNITLTLMKKYGKDKVRGGKWCKIDEPKLDLDKKENMIEIKKDMVDTYIKFFLENEWTQHIIFIKKKKRSCGCVYCSIDTCFGAFKFEDIGIWIKKFKNGFKKVSGKWHLYSENNGALSYHLITYLERRLNVNLNGGVVPYNYDYIDVMWNIFNLHFQKDNLGGDIMLFTLYNYFKP